MSLDTRTRATVFSAMLAVGPLVCMVIFMVVGEIQTDEGWWSLGVVWGMIWLVTIAVTLALLSSDIDEHQRARVSAPAPMTAVGACASCRACAARESQAHASWCSAASSAAAASAADAYVLASPGCGGPNPKADLVHGPIARFLADGTLSEPTPPTPPAPASATSGGISASTITTRTCASTPAPAPAPPGGLRITAHPTATIGGVKVGNMPGARRNDDGWLEITLQPSKHHRI